MYTEEKPRRGGLLKEFIMKLILIIIFVLLLIWLVPWPNMDALNPLKDQIFNANLQTMKEAGITYFTTERLPQNVGDKTTLTLQKMLDMKLVIPFTDRNGNSCDVEKSYVSLEKQETEYLMKVNLKCGEEEDYILVHLGCYSYCTTAICEAKPESTEKPSTTPKVIPTPSYSPKPTITPSPSVTPTPTPTYIVRYTCMIVNGKYWGKYRTVVDEATWYKQCVTPTPSPTPTTTPTSTPTPQIIICSVVNGVYYDNNGAVTNEANYNNVCSIIVNPPTPKTYVCKIVNNQYWGKDGTVVDKATFEKECITPKTYVCKIVDGKYWGKNGTVVSKDTFEKECVTPSPKQAVNKQYQYKKETTTHVAAQYSSWSNWKEYILKQGENVKFEKTNTKEVEDLGTKYVKIGTQAAVYDEVTVTQRIITQEKTVKYKVCKNWEYFAENSKVNRVDSDWQWTDQYYKGFNPPDNTSTTRWIFQGVDYSQCGSDCSNHPYVIYRKQTRKVTTYNNTSDVIVQCAETEEKEVPIYSSVLETKKYKVQLQAAKDVYGYVHYYRVRTRSLLADAKNIINIDYQWSSYNDTTLLSNGYSYTGKTRTVK